jgi:acyl-CoA dehydrogenase
VISFALSEEQKMLQDLARQFAREVIRPAAAHFDEVEETPWEIMREAHKLGLDSYSYPEEFGGGGVHDAVTGMLVTEELSWGCAGIATAINGTHLTATAIETCGTPEQRERYLRMFADPDRYYLGAMCLTEPGAGSDAANIATTAELVGDEWVLNGTKQFITNGGIADIHVVFATTDRKLGWKGIQCFVVEKGTRGMTMGKKEKKMGVRASHTAQVIFDNCRIPRANFMPGPGGSGGLGALKMLERTRPGVGAAAVGIARAALEFAVEYAQQRVTMGKQIIDHQMIGAKLADMATSVDAARMLVWRAAWMADQGLKNTKEASMAKLFAGDTAMQVTIDAIQVLGGYGYIREYPVEKFARDAKIYQIWEGTAEIQRYVISKALQGKLG